MSLRKTALRMTKTHKSVQAVSSERPHISGMLMTSDKFVHSRACSWANLFAITAPKSASAPNNGTPGTPGYCADQALLHSGPGTAIDAFGIIPGSNDAVSGGRSEFHRICTGGGRAAGQCGHAALQLWP